MSVEKTSGKKGRRVLAAAVAGLAGLAAVALCGCGGDDGGTVVNTTPGGGDDSDSFSYGGQTYRTVIIGGRKWMAENLNYTPSSGNSWCYNNSPDSCGKYGRLYDWATAMGLDMSYNHSILNSGVRYQGVCPSGWHLPTNAEWSALVDFAGGSSVAGKKLKATNGWNSYTSNEYAISGNGTDEFGFSALPGGYRIYTNGSFYYAGYYGGWWTASEGSDGDAYGRDMLYIYDDVDGGYGSKEYGSAVRCVED